MSGGGGRLPTVTAMASTNFDAPVIDLTANDSYGGQHPWEQYAWLRANDPVHWHEEADGPGFWAITRYADIRMISRQPKLFSSSARGVMLAESDEMGLMIQRQMMLVMDPPEHDRFKLLVSRGFTPQARRAVARPDPRTRPRDRRRRDRTRRVRSRPRRRRAACRPA